MTDFDIICKNISKKIKIEILPQSTACERLECALYVYLHTLVLKLALLEPEPNNNMDSFFVYEHDFETFCSLLMQKLKTQQNIAICDIYIEAYRLMQKQMPYIFSKITTKNKIISRLTRSLTLDWGLDYRLIKIFGEKAAESFCYSKNNVIAVTNLSIARTINTTNFNCTSNQEYVPVLKKSGVYDVLKHCYGLFMPMHPELFRSFNETEKDLYQTLELKRKKLKNELQQKLGKNYMQLLVGYLFIDINLPIVRAICNDLDFQLCYRTALGVWSKKIAKF